MRVAPEVVEIVFDTFGAAGLLAASAVVAKARASVTAMINFKTVFMFPHPFPVCPLLFFAWVAPVRKQCENCAKAIVVYKTMGWLYFLVSISGKTVTRCGKYYRVTFKSEDLWACGKKKAIDSISAFCKV
jgi:hypothetical protein